MTRRIFLAVLLTVVSVTASIGQEKRLITETDSQVVWIAEMDHRTETGRLHARRH
jgi:hypothetical protein